MLVFGFVVRVLLSFERFCCYLVVVCVGSVPCCMLLDGWLLGLCICWFVVVSPG